MIASIQRWRSLNVSLVPRWLDVKRIVRQEMGPIQRGEVMRGCCACRRMKNGIPGRRRRWRERRGGWLRSSGMALPRRHRGEACVGLIPGVNRVWVVDWQEKALQSAYMNEMAWTEIYLPSSASLSLAPLALPSTYCLTPEVDGVLQCTEKVGLQPVLRIRCRWDRRGET